ncbi:MAG: COR domain-containing protein [Chloroflexota bacterium]
MDQITFFPPDTLTEYTIIVIATIIIMLGTVHLCILLIKRYSGTLQRVAMPSKQVIINNEAIQRIRQCRDEQQRSLSLSELGLTDIPDEVFKLNHLEQLYLSSNRLSTLSDSISQLHNLRELSLSSNQLSTLPDSISQLHNLRELYLSFNQLSTLPNSFYQLHNLFHLDLMGNQLSTLPNCISQLHNLQKLDLCHNRLNTLPCFISQLQNLQKLDLRSNQLSTLPNSITQLHNLQKLYLNSNQFSYPPQEIAQQGINAIRNYFAEANDEDTLYEMKLLLVGEGRVGKTSLAKTLTNPNYQLDPEQSTEGIDIHTWIIPNEELDTEKDFRLNIWDFGGQEIYHATHQFFLTKRSLYLLVTESRREDRHEDFYYWLNIIQLLGDRSPVVVVLNKCDQPTKDLPVREYQERFETIVYDYPQRISCHSDHRRTIDELKHVIRTIITDKDLLPHVGTRLPKVWVDIREGLEQLRSQGRDHVSRREYLDLCAEYGMNEERADFLSDYLHDIGVIIYFRHDIELDNLVTLNPEWITDGVYRVLDNATVKEQQGVFYNRDLQDIWSDDKYRDQRRELLSLMRNSKFEICYELPSNGDNKSYLAPQLLPVDKPKHIDSIWRGEYTTPALRFEYRYEFMPKGLLTRFIVKRHHDIHSDEHGQCHWRYGVLLDYDNTRALVQERYLDRTISIMLVGDNAKRFLDIIRKTIEEIHSNFHNLQVEEMIPCNCTDCANSDKPHFFEYKFLQQCVERRRQTWPCQRSMEEVRVQSLLDNAVYASERDGSRYQSREMRNLLCQFYPNENDILRVMADAGLNPNRIRWGTPLDSQWYAVLTEAEHSGRIQSLMDVVVHDYGENSEFRRIYNA